MEPRGHLQYYWWQKTTISSKKCLIDGGVCLRKAYEAEKSNLKVYDNIIFYGLLGTSGKNNQKGSL